MTQPTQQQESDTDTGCSSAGCQRAAVWAVRFHGQPGHVHDCEEHTAVLREWSDVAEAVPVELCPWGGHDVQWTDDPRPL